MDDNVKNMCYINNRRYLGNKYSLSDYIRKVVDENCEDIVSFLDIFYGTDIDKILPPTRRFGGGNHEEKKKTILAKI